LDQFPANFPRPQDFQLAAQSDAEDVAWFNIKKLPRRAFDHKKIIDVAIKRLRGKITVDKHVVSQFQRIHMNSDHISLAV
jgi:hypothetical protein